MMTCNSVSWYLLNLKTEWSGRMRGYDPAWYYVMFRNHNWYCGCVVCVPRSSLQDQNTHSPSRQECHLWMAQYLHPSPETYLGQLWDILHPNLHPYWEAIQSPVSEVLYILYHEIALCWGYINGQDGDDLCPQDPKYIDN